MRWLISILMVLMLTGVAVGQEMNWGPSPVPVVTETRLLSWGESSSILVYVWTPFQNAMYRIKIAVFNSKGERIRTDDSGWYMRPSWAGHFVYECPTKLLKGEGYYVKAVVKYAPYIHNER